MNSSNKRPFDSLSRGDSPPDKRSRAENRQPHARYAHPGSPTILSPPTSRKSSFAGLPSNVPMGPRSNQYRSSSTSDKRFHDEHPRGAPGASRDVRAMSSGSVGSGASTPTSHLAPPAPSMLPGAGATPYANLLHRQDEATGENGPTTMDSLRRLKDRRKAIAFRDQPIVAMTDDSSIVTTPSTNSPSQLQAKITAQHIDIDRLKKERLEMLNRLDALEKRELVSESSSVSQNVEQLKLLSDRIEKLEVAAFLHAGDVQSDLDPVNNANNALDNVLALKNDVALLKSWKETQSKTITEQDIRNLVIQEVIEKTDTAKKALRTEVGGLLSRIEGAEETLKYFASGVTMSLDFKDDVVKHKFPEQFKGLWDKVREIERNNLRTYSKTKTLETDVEKLRMDIDKDHANTERDIDKLFSLRLETDRNFMNLSNQRQKTNDDLDQLAKDIDKYIGPIKTEYETAEVSLLQRLKKMATPVGQIPSLQSNVVILQRNLKKLVDEQIKFSSRLGALESAATAPDPGHGSEKVAKPAVLSPTTNDMRIGQLQQDVKQLAKKFADIEKCLAVAEHFEENLAKLDARLSKDNLALRAEHETSLAKLQGGLSENIHALEKKLSEVEPLAPDRADGPDGAQPDLSEVINQLNEVKEMLGNLDLAVAEVETKVHQNTDDIAVIQESVPALFRQVFDPFKLTVEQQLRTINDKIEAHGGDNVKLGQLGPASGTLSPLNTITDVKQTQIKWLAQDVTQLKSAFKENNRDIQHQLTTKADTHAIDQQMDHFKLTLRSLEERYNNITTDELHQRMVHWFVRMYPSNQVNLLTEFTRMQEDLNHLKSVDSQFNWLRSRTEDLTSLLDNAQQLQVLVQAIPELQRLQQTWANIQVACSDAKMAITKVEESGLKVDQQAKQIDSLQKSLHNLNSDTSPFAKTEALVALEENLQKTCVAMGEHLEKTSLNSMNEFRAASGKEHNQRVEAENKLRSSILECKQQINQIPDLTPQVEKLQESSAQLRREFDTVNNTLIEPNRDVFGYFGTLLAVVCQIQDIIESMNQNQLKPRPLKIEWIHHLATLEPLEVNGDSGKS
ncbi:hypothetical protein EJ02DRAFT_470937 [Clathrospora elynae]|uniref:Uncharacterized protein n=1 Tax=Clathrospora elynae TaxID=706981 RepID=A0A6A5S8I7_9PLEO|nr:hypothetical protein EJ02DRAFT_470937 [Clathrospora elynae]